MMEHSLSSEFWGSVLPKSLLDRLWFGTGWQGLSTQLKYWWLFWLLHMAGTSRTVAAIPRIYHLVGSYFVALTWGDRTRRRLDIKKLTHRVTVSQPAALLPPPQTESKGFSCPLGRQEAVWGTEVNLQCHYIFIIYTFIIEMDISNIGRAMKWIIVDSYGRLYCDQ